MKTRHIAIVIGICFLITLAAGPGAAKVREFDYPPLNTFEVPQPTKVVLDNGLALYLLEDHELPKINISVTINQCGSYLEPPAKVGLADMTGEVMRTGGTASMKGDQIDEELEAIGASVETSIGRISGSAGANALSEYADKVIAILADVLRNPVFDEDKIDLARTSRKSDISRRNDEPMGIVIREYRKLIFGSESPYARHAEYATIDAITRNDMVMFHKMIVQPNNMQMAIVGDFDKDEMVELIKTHFGDWAAGETEIPVPPEVKYTFQPTVNYAEKTDVNQSNILIGHIGGQMGDPDYPATIVMNSILGGSFGSRLTDVVRTKMGLAYTAQGQFSFNYGYPGWFYAYAATKSESTVKAIRAMIEQIRSMQTTPATAEEMKKAKDGWLNSFVFNFDTKGKVLSRMMTYDYYGLPSDYLQQLKEAVEQVTPEDVIEVAKRKLNPDSLQILVVGKGEDFDEPLSVFGSLKEIDITIPSPAVEEFTATEEELAQGLAWLGKSVTACGGVENFKKIKTITSSSKVTISMPQGAMTVDADVVRVLPDRVSQTLKTPMGQQKTVFNGETGWISAGGQSQLMSGDQLTEQNKDIERDLLLVFAASDAPGYKVAYKGEEEFEGKPAIRLDFMTAGGTQFTMYLDPETSRPAGMKYMGMTMAGPGENLVTFTEYGEYSGVKVPVKMARNSGGMSLEIEVTAYNVNGEIDMSVFDKPEGI